MLETCWWMKVEIIQDIPEKDNKMKFWMNGKSFPTDSFSPPLNFEVGFSRFRVKSWAWQILKGSGCFWFC